MYTYHYFINSFSKQAVKHSRIGSDFFSRGINYCLSFNNRLLIKTVMMTFATMLMKNPFKLHIIIPIDIRV